jgi:outer membrane murein-binding lipoprotein Lpp
MGPINLDSTAWVQKDKVQESIDTLNAAIDRLDKIINEMQDNCQCKK